LPCHDDWNLKVTGYGIVTYKMIPVVASVRLRPVMLPVMLDGLPVMLPDLPVMFPAKAVEETARVKRVVQTIDLKRFIVILLVI
jgi:hypothetical protein